MSLAQLDSHKTTQRRGFMMVWAIPEYSRSDVDRAGQVLIGRGRKDKSIYWAFGVLDNWRASHGYPLNTFQATLRSRLKRLKIQGFVSQRLKRYPSIQYKMLGNQKMKLSRMHDIGGLRAVVSNMKQVDKLVSYYLDDPFFKHELVDVYDYVTSPKESGYRSIHLVFKYKNPRAHEKHQNLRIEIQVRSNLQHAWATAVETLGTYLDFALKSGDGPTMWLDFFTLAGSAFAYYEGCPPVPILDHLSREETYQRVVEQAKKLQVRENLLGFSVATSEITENLKGSSFYVVVLDLVDKTVQVEGYGREKQAEAANEYANIEKRVADGEKLQAVMVGAQSVKELRKAYPSYFLDTQAFLRYLSRIEKEVSNIPT